MLERLKSRGVLRATGKSRFLTDAESRALACTWPRHVQQRALTITRLLKPYALTRARKIRVGGEEDGGYVMVDDFEGVETAFSLGVGPNVDWDYEIADRGLPVHQFDHTVSEPPRTHANFHFHKRMIAATETEGADTLVDMLEHAVTHRPFSSILKIDIENAEWGVFAHAQKDVFDKFSQVLCEFHAFEHFADDWHYDLAFKGLCRLKEFFEVVHVHANNSAGVTYIQGAPIPFVIEVTLVNRSRYDTGPSQESFPTPLDRPNDRNKPDYHLRKFEA